jgi:hypothetical protein
LSGRRALIVVNPATLRHLDAVSIIPMADGRALIALEPGKTAADLELALLDRMERIAPDSSEYRELEFLRASLKHWRQVDRLRFHLRSVIVVERGAGRRLLRPVPRLKGGRSPRAHKGARQAS